MKHDVEACEECKLDTKISYECHEIRLRWRLESCF